MFYQGDVCLETTAKGMVDAAIRAFGALDILVNNAGIVVPGRVDTASLQDWDTTLAVNACGVFLASKYALPEPD